MAPSGFLSCHGWSGQWRRKCFCQLGNACAQNHQPPFMARGALYAPTWAVVKGANIRHLAVREVPHPQPSPAWGEGEGRLRDLAANPHPDGEEHLELQEETTHK